MQDRCSRTSSLPGSRLPPPLSSVANGLLPSALAQSAGRLSRSIRKPFADVATRQFGASLAAAGSWNFSAPARWCRPFPIFTEPTTSFCWMFDQYASGSGRVSHERIHPGCNIQPRECMGIGRYRRGDPLHGNLCLTIAGRPCAEAAGLGGEPVTRLHNGQNAGSGVMPLETWIQLSRPQAREANLSRGE